MAPAALVKDLPGLFLAVVLGQPARAFGNAQQQHNEDHGRHGADAEHPPPAEDVFQASSPQPWIILLTNNVMNMPTTMPS